MLDAFDADLLILGRDRGVRGASDGDIGREVCLMRQRLGEIEADAWRGRFIVDLVIDDAETVFLTQVLIDLAHVLIVAAIEAGVIGVERWAPHFVPREEIAKQRQRLGLLRRGGRVLKGGVSGGLAMLDEIVAAVRLRFVRLRAKPGEREPACRVFGIGDNGRAEQCVGGLVVARGYRRAGFLAQRLGALALDLGADLRGLFAQRLVQPHDIAREIVANIGFNRGGRDRRAGRDEESKRKQMTCGPEHVSTFVAGNGRRRTREMETVKTSGDGVFTGRPMLAWPRDTRGVGMGKSRCLAGGLLMALAIGGASPLAFSQPAASPDAPAAATAPDPQKSAFVAMPEADRAAVQEALGWLGLYNGTLDGAYGKRTRDSIVAYQQSVGAIADGVVTPVELDALKAATRRAEAAVDFALIDDKISGVRIGAPMKLLLKFKPSSPDTTLQSGDGALSLILAERSPPKTAAAEDDGLAALYAQFGAEAGDRKVTYKALKAGAFFVVAGQDKGARFYTRYARAPADWPPGPSLRGFTFVFPADRAADFDKIALAIANAFDPFPDTPASHGAAAMRAKSTRSALDVVRVAAGALSPSAPTPSPSPDARPTPTASPASAAPSPMASATELTATALLVAPGEALTALPADKCGTITLDGKPAKLLQSDPASGLVLIGGDFAAGQSPTLVAGASDLLALSLAPAGGGKAKLEASSAAVAPLSDGRSAIVAALGAGASGAPAFDRSGALAGVVAAIATPPRRVGTVVLAAPYPLIGAEAIAAFLQLAAPAAPAATPALAAGEIVARESGLVAEVQCRP
ncbi:MAG: peptidoglycan-binding protein [Bradyrhizobium sp.]|nr:MAG: peptidoglycan-binding protein [Bradyrhizobium sp.]